MGWETLHLPELDKLAVSWEWELWPWKLERVHGRFAAFPRRHLQRHTRCVSVYRRLGSVRNVHMPVDAFKRALLDTDAGVLSLDGGEREPPGKAAKARAVQRGWRN